MKTFLLVREDDSGRKVEVAEGVEFTDWTVVVRWTVPDMPRSTVVWQSIDDAMRIHGQDGKTTVEWW